MTNGTSLAGLVLTEEEAFALLVMCLTSPHGIDRTTESALKKLAAHCADLSNHTHSLSLFEARTNREVKEAGA